MNDEIKEIKKCLDRLGIKYHENHFGSEVHETTQLWFNICKTKVQITDYYATPGLIYWDSKTSVDGLTVDEVKERLRETTRGIDKEDLEETASSLRAYCAFNNMKCQECTFRRDKSTDPTVCENSSEYVECGIGWPLDWNSNF